MSTTLDSEEHFKERVLQIGFTEANLLTLQTAGWTTLGRFAVSCSQAPGTLASEQAFIDQVLTPLWGAPCPAGTMALTRRLFSEAYTSVVRTNERAHNRWLALVQRLYSLRHLQRLFAYTGHHLQTFPKTLRERIKTL
jgi:hypothetical protein